MIVEHRSIFVQDEQRRRRSDFVVLVTVADTKALPLISVARRSSRFEEIRGGTIRLARQAGGSGIRVLFLLLRRLASDQGDEDKGDADEDDAQNSDDDEDKEFTRVIQRARGREGRVRTLLVRRGSTRSVLQIRQAIVQMRTERVVFLDDRLHSLVLVDHDQFQQFLVEVVLSIDDLRGREDTSSHCSSLDLLERRDNKLLRSTLTHCFD